LDRLDRGILKILLANNGVPPGTHVFRKSFRSIANELRVDQGTIRSRMKKFQEQRTLKGWYLGVSPGLTGHDVGHAWLTVEPESRKNAVIDGLLSAPEVERVCNYLGPKVSFIFLVEKGADSNTSMKSLAAHVDSNMVLHKQGVVQVPTRVLKETDSSIIASLRENPWKPYPTVAKEIGISAKTVARRVARLSQDGSIYMLPIVDLKALQGIIPVELVVDYLTPKMRAEVNERIASHVGEGLLFYDNSGPYGYFALIVPNLSQIEQVVKWTKQQSGVKEARVDALLDVTLNRSHYEQWRASKGREVTGSLAPRPSRVTQRTYSKVLTR
jgi:DNA-binding Lrp family transcriptional regulator